MNGIEKITGRIEGDAQKEMDEMMAQAQAQAADITARYRAQAEREAQDIKTRGRRAADERVERLESVAQLEARKLQLAAKQAVLEEAYDLALQKLISLPDEEYVELLAALAAKAAVTGREKVILSQKDRTRVGKAVATRANELLAEKGSLTLAEEARPMKGGVVLSDGAVEVNCTFETLVRLQRGILDREVAQVLFL